MEVRIVYKFQFTTFKKKLRKFQIYQRKLVSYTYITYITLY